MNLSCDNKILEDVRYLIKDNILPRLTQLEVEIRELRKVTWPVCQSLRESSQLSDIENKRRFLQMLIDSDEVKQLLDGKAAVSTRPLIWSSAALTQEELSVLHIRDHLGLLIQSK
jgi:hypothetical protein